MDGIYTATLLVSLGSGAVALVMGLSILFASFRPSGTEATAVVLNLRWLSMGAIVLAVFALAISLLVHIGWGHRPGTFEALTLQSFLEEHPAYLIALVLPVLAIVLLAIARPLAASRSS